jgi:hypothetical protein
MSDLRIILDKSVVFGLKNPEIDSLDRYFFQIVPSILTNEIVADLTKGSDDKTIKNQISQHSYRISGNRGIPVHYKTLLANSLMGNELPMDGRFIPAGQTTVRGADGSIGTTIETRLEDDTIARWERREFTEQETIRAEAWRRKIESPIYSKGYLDHIARAGLAFTPPKNDKELVAIVDSLLQERKFQPRIFPLLARAFRIPLESQDTNIKRWFKEGRPMFEDFAPYAFFCIRANLLLALGLTNPNIFTPDKNDRKDLEYCYYLPHCEIFASNDRKHKRLERFLLRDDQSFVKGDDLKNDLRKLSEMWDRLSQAERTRIRDERGGAPVEDEHSIVFRLWKKHRGKVPQPFHRELLKAMVVDSSKPKEEQIPITLAEMFIQLIEKTKPSIEVPFDEAIKMEDTSFAVRTTRIRKDRILKLYPHLTQADLDKMPDSD